MKERNYQIDYLKGLLVIGVFIIHTGTFLLDRNFNMTQAFIYNALAIIVPLFYVVSGYLMNKSRNNVRNTNHLIKLYLIYSVIIMIFNSWFGIGTTFVQNLQSIFLYTQGLGYLWFVKNLIIYRMIYILATETNFKHMKTHELAYVAYIIFVFGFYLFTPIGHITGQYAYIYFVMGISFANQRFVKLSPYLLLLVFTVPYVNGYKYNIDSATTCFVTAVIFLSMLNVKVKRRYRIYFERTVGALGRHTIEYLFIQYFVITTLKNSVYEFTSLFTGTLLTFGISTLLLIVIYTPIKMLSKKLAVLVNENLNS